MLPSLCSDREATATPTPPCPSPQGRKGRSRSATTRRRARARDLCLLPGFSTVIYVASESIRAPSSAAEGEPGDALHRVRGAALLDSTLVVANGGTSQLFYYGLDGRFVTAVGAEGDGPGERVEWTVFTRTGTFRGRVRMPAGFEQLPASYDDRFVALFEDELGVEQVRTYTITPAG